MSPDPDGTGFVRRAMIAFAIVEALVIALLVFTKLDLLPF
jgi:hypothetical protein